MIKRSLVLVLMLAFVGLAIWGLPQWLGHGHSGEVTGSGTIETTDITVGSRVGGRVTQVFAAEGQTMEAQGPILALDGYQLPMQQADLDEKIAQAQAQLDALVNGARPQELDAARAQAGQAQAQAQLVQEGPRKEDITQAQASKRQALADLENARANRDRFETLWSRHVISAQEHDAAHTSYLVAKERYEGALAKEKALLAGSRPQEIAMAQKQLEAQRAQYALVKAGPRPEAIAAQRALVESLKAQKAQVQKAVDELQVVSPCACEVSGLNIKPGQLILPNATVATLVNLDDLWVRVYIPEEVFGRVQPGDNATVTVDAWPGEHFKGKVVQLASRAEFTPRNVQTVESRKLQVFGVKVAIDNQARKLRPGMVADVIFTPKRQDAK